jgi:hypothetical protein
MSAYKALRIIISVFLIPIGAVLILLNVAGAAGSLVTNLGLALIVTGIVSTFQETILQRLAHGEVADAVADRVHKHLQQSPLTSVGIRMVSPIRKGLDRYYLWAMSTAPQIMFFAGRSVLHRIDYDFKVRGLGTAENVIARRLKQGAQIRIMFLDPRSDLIERLAKEEDQAPEQLLTDVATSIGVCNRLHKLLKDFDQTAASLDIRVYNEIPYFAYHAVEENVIAGFYFSSALGHASAAFEIVDPQTRTFFESHFLSIFNRARDTWLLQIPAHRNKAELNTTLMSQLKKSLTKSLGEERVSQLTEGSRPPVA